HSPARPGDRFPRAERRRQVHHDAADPRPGRAGFRVGHGRRPAVCGLAAPAAGGRGAAGGQGVPRRSHRPKSPAVPGGQQRDQPRPRRRSTGLGGPPQYGAPAGRRVPPWQARPASDGPRSAQARELAALLTARGATVTRQDGDTLAVTRSTPEEIGELARADGLTLTGLTADQATLEDRYMELTRDAADYRAAPGEPATM